MIGTHNKTINGPDSADDRSYYVAALWIESRRGPAVLQLEFDNHALSSDEISSVHELEPRHMRGLSAAQRAQLDEAFAARGGEAADAAVSELEPARTSAATWLKPGAQLTIPRTFTNDVISSSDPSSWRNTAAGRVFTKS